MHASLIEETRRHWASLRGEIERHFALLWDEAELPNMEYASSAALSAWLEREGFAVERKAHGIPTAFIGRWGSSPREGPRIGLLLEYDALPSTGNKPAPRREPSGKRAGHACGHNQIGPANLGAAIAARRALE